MMKRGMADKQGESMVASYRYLGVSNPGLQTTPGPHSSMSEEFLHSIILRPKKPLGRWNLVNPLLSMNEALMDECAARLQPLVDQYKPRQHQTFAIEKFRDLIVTTSSCPGDKKIFFQNFNNLF